MDFSSISEKRVVSALILPYLEFNDLLRFRRVSSTTKAITDAYIRVNPQVVPEIEINEDKKSFKAFMAMNIPTTKLFLNNISGDMFYEKQNQKDFDRFLRRYGSCIKSLRVVQFSFYVYGKEWTFLEELSQLETFTADHIGFGVKEKVVCNSVEVGDALRDMYSRARKDPRHVGAVCAVPNVLKRLSFLKIGNQKKVLYCNILTLSNGFSHVGRELQYFGLPFNCYMKPTECDVPSFSIASAALYRIMDGLLDNPESSLMLAFCNAMVVMVMRNRDKTSPTKLKAVDFFNYHKESDYGGRQAYVIENARTKFVELCKKSLAYDVKLLNVNSDWFPLKYGHSAVESKPELGTVIVSLVNISPQAIFLNMTNLESIVIKSTAKSSIDTGDSANWRDQRPNWPNLKKLEIGVDSLDRATDQLFLFFFRDVSRVALAELSLQFCEKNGRNLSRPKVQDIMDSCPNLKKITIANWPGKGHNLAKLWIGLRGLESVSLSSCKNLDDMAFIDKNIERPEFFKLSKLKRLELKALDQMPRITDSLFSNVICHLSLSHFVITSDKPLQSITASGINSLSNGDFAKSIEKFPFKNWSLEGVSSGQFLELEKKFRSYNMI